MEIDKDRMLKISESLDEDNKKRKEIYEELYKVGYRRPPISGQFKKGQSGNPKGRPARKPLPKNIQDAIMDSLLKEVQITNQNGKKEKKALFELFADKVVQDSIKNDGQSRRMLLQNLNLLKVDLRQIVRDKAYEDFEPTTSREDERYFRNVLNELVHNNIEDIPDDEDESTEI